MNKKDFFSVCIIGAGKLAWSLIPALQETGYNIESIISRDISDAKKISGKFKIKKDSDSISDLPAKCNLVLLTLPDDQLSIISAKIASLNKKLNEKLFIHFSGVSGSAILKKLSAKGASTASFHIMLTFPSARRVKLDNSFAAIESHDKKTEEFLFTLASDLKLNAFRLDPAKKTEYHLAGVFTSNFLVSNFYTAEKLFHRIGSKTDFTEVINPIIKLTLRNIRARGSFNSLSGPVERGDLNSIKLHVKTLRKDKPLLRNYIVQSLSILDIIKEQEEVSPAHKKIKDYLTGQLKNIPV
jgi:predicted short-subunit dehydrogenase-like oxidoreductase (DUF2520 family)